jgi:protein N-terminal methyltransferase
VVWVQWVFGHLTDADGVSFLARCKSALKPHGVICLKENTISDSAFCVDKEDSSITRSGPYYKELFRLAGLEVVLEVRQREFPADLYPVYMYALG